MDEILIILRALSNTLESDNSLMNLIITSSIIVKREFTFDVDYLINITNQTITPDPTDNGFILLVAYKAAILLLQTEIRSYSYQSVKIVDGPSTIDLSGRSKDLKVLLDSIIADYNNIKKDYLLNQEGGSFGYAVLTPTTVEYIRANNFS
jgi:hypothetical protein